jgi:peptidoglycan/LPS O-acetylase OafA/YrhL
MKKLLYLESLRGIAATSVALHHFSVNSILQNNYYVKNSYLMVDFFFVLSGFVIAYNYMDKLTNTKNLINFQIKRFLRLYPLHFLVLLAFLFKENAIYYFEKVTGVQPNTPVFSVNNLESFVHNVLLAHSFGLERLTYNHPSWSISTEFFTYLIFGIIIIAIRNYKLQLITIIITMLLCIFFLNDFRSETTYESLLRCIYCFFLGVLGFNFFKYIKFSFPVWSQYLFLISSVTLVTYGHKVYAPLIVLSFSLLIMSLVQSKNSLMKKILEKPFLVYLGTISYGIYMIHYIIWWIIAQFFRFVVKIPTVLTEGNTTIVFENIFFGTSVTIIGLLIIIALSHLSYKFFEVPINNFKSKIKIV